MKRFEAFEKKYLPISNGEGSILLETYGEDLEKVRKADSGKVWTLLDCDGVLFVASGFHFVNRLNYILTAKPWRKRGEVFYYYGLA